MVLQRIHDFTEHGADFDAALDDIRRSTIFTTHTPVPAGHDAFTFELVEKHLAGCWGTLGANRDWFLALGAHDSGGGTQFNMTALAMRSAANINGVSRLHGEVTRAMWGDIWPGVAAEDRPVAYVTNGVHAPTWIAGELAELFTKTSAPAGSAPGRSRPVGRGAGHPRQRALGRPPALRRYCSPSSANAPASAGPTSTSARRASSPPARCSIPMSLTIGFARRFAGYKRPELVFTDPERLARILNAAGGRCSLSSPARRTRPTYRQERSPGVYRRALDPLFGGRVACWKITSCTWRTSWSRDRTCG